MHGGFASRRRWYPAAALLLAEELTCFPPDLRACGKIDRPDDPVAYGIEQKTVDLADSIGHLGLQTLHLVGPSSGAAIALTSAFAHPARLTSLTPVEWVEEWS